MAKEAEDKQVEYLESEEEKPSEVSDTQGKKLSAADELAMIQTAEGRRVGKWGIWLSPSRHKLTIANREQKIEGGRQVTIQFKPDELKSKEAKEYKNQFKVGFHLNFSNLDPYFQIDSDNDNKQQWYIINLNEVDAHPVYKELALKELERLNYRERTEIDQAIIAKEIEIKNEYEEKKKEIKIQKKRLDKVQRRRK